MLEAQKTISVSKAAALCDVGRTTVGYWIRSKKLHALRIGRNYSIPVEDLLIFLQNSGQKIPSKLLRGNCSRALFKSFQNCWQYWYGSDHGRRCHGCITFKNQLHACFTVKDSGLLGCSGCDECSYYLDTFYPRIQFVHQILVPAAIFKDMYLWGGNYLCAEMCRVQPKDLVGMGIEKIVHASSLAKIIEALRRLALGDPVPQKNCRISVNSTCEKRREIFLSVYPLREPEKAFLVLAPPIREAEIISDYFA